MEFFALLLLIALRHQWPELEPAHLKSRPDWLLAVLAAAAVAALDFYLRHALWGLPGLLLAVGALWFACGRRDAERALQRYRLHLQRNDLEGARLEAENSELVPALASADDLERLQALVQRSWLQQQLESWFAPVLWFCLLGPGGAVAYRLLQGERRLAWLDDAPARLLALSFSLTGDFQRGYPAAREALLGPFASDLLLLRSIEASAPAAAPANGPACDQVLGQRQRLIERTRLLWLCAIALGVIAL